ncbi:stress protein [Magnetococcus marinus MC-1]|uniref:Stress protein n=1 Tax=Magnetococcus marinus (strain ATCC BAA-1437 / JCM 17883 / MC-1) TaxID=156889 RepID=A0L896_MAGMM|nr:TerD family protein [Magnetococcus marinus]ABK44189.1 stress protein [Magnetococcus marinus MC-1]
MSKQLHLDEDFFLFHEGQPVTKLEIWYQWERDDRATARMVDMDLSAVMLGVDERMLLDEQMVFYNNTQSPCGSITHMGDQQALENRSAEERLKINLATVPEDIVQIVISATIPQEDIPAIHLGMLRRAHYGLVVAGASSVELAHREFHPGGEGEFGWLLGLFYRNDQAWVFRAVREALPDGMGTLQDHFTPFHGDY